MTKRERHLASIKKRKHYGSVVSINNQVKRWREILDPECTYSAFSDESFLHITEIAISLFNE